MHTMSDNHDEQQQPDSPIERRLMRTHVQLIMNPSDIDDAVFQHSVLCQTFLPYRNPGPDTRIWQQRQGNASLAIQAQETLNPDTGKYEFMGLPYGAKARLILAHINSEAVKTQNPVIDVESSMTGFIRRLGLGTDGKTLRGVKEQLRRLTTSTLSIGFVNPKNESAIQVDLKLVKAFNLWFQKDDSGRVLWSNTIQLTNDYFESLLGHAIPLDERALAALAHNAMAMDIYAWLAQRLHRINPERPQFVAWASLKEQFGSNYSEMRKFKQVFRKTLKFALLQYPNARLEEKKNEGIILYHSPTPIPTKVISMLDSGK